MCGLGTWSTALRAFLRLATRKLRSGLLFILPQVNKRTGVFPQNFWINGQPYWSGIQLDETAFPVLLAWRLRSENGLRDFDPYPMVLRAASYLIRHGPATEQDRWEEADIGYAPYITRLDHLQLQSLWDKRPHVPAWYDRLMERHAYKEGLEDWFNASYLSLMKEKGSEVQSRVKAIIESA